MLNGLLLILGYYCMGKYLMVPLNIFVCPIYQPQMQKRVKRLLKSSTAKNYLQ